MKTLFSLPAAAIALTVCAAAVQAQSQAPGLWEQTMSMKSEGGEMEKAMADMQKQLAAMPPDQRKQVEQAMAGRGVKVGPQGTVVKVCVSKEQAARPAEPTLRGDCKNTDLKRSGNSLKFKFECSKPQPSSGDGEWTFAGDKAYSGRITSTTQVAGKPQQTRIDVIGKWLAADCGSIKPHALPGS